MTEGLEVVGDGGEWLTAGEAAKRLRVSIDVVRRAIKHGQLTAGRTPGGHRRVSPQSVDALFREMYPGEEPPIDDDPSVESSD